MKIRLNANYLPERSSLKSLILTADDIRKIVQHIGLDNLMDRVISELTYACDNYGAGNYKVHSRAGFDDGKGGLIEWMPVVQGQDSATIKLVGYHPDNPSTRSLPTILSVAMTFDVQSGHLLALSDSTFSTAIRTGAASAVVSKILAKPASKTLGLIGAGAQAVSQLHALSRVFDFEHVMVADTNNAIQASFADRATAIGLGHLDIRCQTNSEVAQAADILCTATSVGVGHGQVFNDSNLQEHLHVNAVGADFPGKFELPIELLNRAFVATDFEAQALLEGECQRLSKQAIGPDLVGLVQGATQYQGYQNRNTVFDSTGFALEDHVVVRILHDLAKELNVGTFAQIEAVSSDPTNPYAFAISEPMLTTAADLILSETQGFLSSLE